MNKLNVLPTLLEEQVEIIEWARTLRDKHFSVSTIIEWLVSSDKISKHHKDLGIEEMRQRYKKYSPSKELVITAILTNHYRLKNDISEGQIVSDGNIVGFAHKIDYISRTFDLHSDSHGNAEYFIGKYAMDNFSKVQVN